MKATPVPADCFVAITDRGEAFGWHDDPSYLSGFVAAVLEAQRAGARPWRAHEFQTLRVVSRDTAEGLGLKPPFWARVGEWE